MSRRSPRRRKPARASRPSRRPAWRSRSSCRRAAAPESAVLVDVAGERRMRPSWASAGTTSVCPSSASDGPSPRARGSARPGSPRSGRGRPARTRRRGLEQPREEHRGGASHAPAGSTCRRGGGRAAAPWSRRCRSRSRNVSPIARAYDSAVPDPAVTDRETADRLAIRDLVENLGGLARRRRLGSFRDGLARRRPDDGDLVPGTGDGVHPRQPRGLRARRAHPPLPRRHARSTSPATARSRRRR